MTKYRLIYIYLQRELFSFLADHYILIARYVMGDEEFYELKHESNGNSITLLANFKYQFLKIYKNGKWRKTIEM